MLHRCAQCSGVLDSTYKDLCKRCYKTNYYNKNKDKLQVYHKAHFEKTQKAKHSIKNCAQCSNEFMPKSNLAKCCSQKCSAALWRQEHQVEQNAYFHNLYHTSIQRRISTCIRSRVNHALKGSYKKYSIIKSLGCSPDELIKHLESQFTANMSWDNYGKGYDKWNIDHIKPLAFFDLSDDEQFVKANHYSNLQPLWEPDNIAKGAS